ncbi:XK-related protein 9 [Pholidichthys leucotaenia]
MLQAYSRDEAMHPSDFQFSKLRWLLSIIGVLLYVGDIWTDIGLALKYFADSQYIWTGFTITFVLMGMLVTQIFSFAWYWDDMNDVLINPEGKSNISGISKSGFAVLHVFGLGIFTRYYHMLIKGYKMIWKMTDSFTAEEIREVHHELFCMAADLSMLRLFESFLESVPQLLLQLYLLLGHGGSVLQYISVIFSFLSIAWALVDYRRCLRRSVPHIREMPLGTPTAVYFLYKVCTITSLILSYSFLLILSVYSTIPLAIIWFLGTIWTHLLQTNFCSSGVLELLYRGVIGFILIFTFFNVKGQDTKVATVFYYTFVTVINVTAIVLFLLLKPELQGSTCLHVALSGVITTCLALGLVCLVWYYLSLHPRGMGQEADEVDDMEQETASTRRLKNFLQP